MRGVCALWVGNRDGIYGLNYDAIDRSHGMSIRPLGIVFDSSRFDDPSHRNPFRGWRWTSVRSNSGTPWQRHRWLGFYADALTQELYGIPNGLAAPTRMKYVVIPCWAAAVATGLLPLLWLARRVCRPMPEGSCPRCGYDLRASSDRCPECGTEAKAPA